MLIRLVERKYGKHGHQKMTLFDFGTQNEKIPHWKRLGVIHFVVVYDSI